jgi:hypothetical protein
VRTFPHIFLDAVYPDGIALVSLKRRVVLRRSVSDRLTNAEVFENNGVVFFVPAFAPGVDDLHALGLERAHPRIDDERSVDARRDEVLWRARPQIEIRLLFIR